MLSVRQAKALDALLTHPSKAEAAKAAQISPRTMSKYLADDEFQAAYKAAISELVGDATRQAQQALSPALKALKGIVEDDDEPSSVRVSAARALLEYGLKFTEFNDVIAELRRLEGGGF